LTEGVTMGLLYATTVAGRLPRIWERWPAPLMRGAEYFFDVAVLPEFSDGPGVAILRRYRVRLFIPWLVEGAILGALWLAGLLTPLNIGMVVFLITLFTRLNYYAARISAENHARRYECPVASQPVANLALSLEPRTLAAYTNWYVELGIVLAFALPAVWLAVLSTTSFDASIIRRLIRVLILFLYLQAGSLLIKRGVVHAGAVAPADNPEQYLAWRDSLRRFTTTVCDMFRLMIAFPPVLLVAIIAGGQTFREAALPSFFAFCIAAGVYEWRRRLKHLEVTRRTRPAKLPLLPGAEKMRGLFCFSPSLPVLLLRTANGYALNLASAPVPIAGLYMVGFACLWIWLVR
jgi:hypothetical protein